MKKTILSLSIVALAVTAFAQFNPYTGAPAPAVVMVTLTPGVPALVKTNNLNVVGVQLVTTLGTGTVSFYDNNATNAPYNGTNYVTAAYATTRSFTTNYVTSYVGANGYTNFYTNAGLWTLTYTNAAATNALSPKGVLPLIGGTVTSGNNQMRFVSGIVALATTNATAIITYLPNQ